jgi:predicted dehydrogenase/threonine dehydrogenase-like Zn-dependent dehydrogenase
MKQLLQRLDNGETQLIDVPVPSASGVNLVVQSRATLISAGTERMLVDFGKANVFQKARKQPDKVKQVLDKMRTDGVGTTLEAVRAKLDAPIPLGYCQAGVVQATGGSVRGFKPGDRVVTNGPHAEYVRVPHTLAARIPDEVSFEEAAFTPVAAIGLQGLRLAEPTMGETVVVVGLGLIGLLTVQLARANGCRVIGIDRDAERMRLAADFGAEVVEASDNAVDKVVALTDGIGADIVLLTLASSSDEPIHQAAEMCRKRGRIVLVGVTGLNLRRDDFYQKEISFQVSCSYGPGRYDAAYEDEGRDYPLPFVRWTEQRNFEAVLGLMARGQLDIHPLITHRFAIADSQDAYRLLSSDEPSLGIVLTYSGDRDGDPARTIARREPPSQAQRGTVGVIGAGNFAVRTLLPVLKDEARLHTIASGGGTSGAVAAEKFDFERSTTDLSEIFDHPEIDTVFVLTRHDSHAGMAIRGLEAGKNVFVEKPLALTDEELDRVEEAARVSEGRLIVGFNRRFAPLTDETRKIVSSRSGPLAIVATINAGGIPRDHWTQDPNVGGGRIVGEACHWLDLARSLVGAPISELSVLAARDRQGRAIDDIAHLSVLFVDGSTAVVHYLANGSKSFPKERIECFFDEKTLVIDNWRRLRRFGVAGPLLDRPKKMDKGHEAEVKSWMKSIKSGDASPIALDEIMEVSRWAVKAGQMARDETTN